MSTKSNLPDLLTPIKQALCEIHDKSDFCAIEHLTPAHFQVTVKNFGQLKFPLTKQSSQKLISLAQPAKFGLRGNTLYDPKVRDVWEIPGKEIKVADVSQDKKFNEALTQIKEKLGLPPKASLSAELHNLLIYEKKQFFSSHQDTEKTDGMIATLVVILPSPYKGGTLQIEHKNEKLSIKSKDTPHSKLTFVAFYADCLHSVKPVTNGFRVALTYNLILKGSHSHQKNNLINNSSLKESIQDFFQCKPIKNDCSDTNPKKLVYILDHEYTDAGLSWQTLKSSDSLRAEALLQVADELELTIHLGIAELQELWDTIPNSDFYESGYNQAHYYDDESGEEVEYDENEDYDEIDGDYELSSLIEESITIKTWVNSKDKSENFPELGHNLDDVISTTPNDNFTPFQDEFEGYMGNYGNTVDRWYHRAVVILWQKKDTQSIHLAFNPSLVIKETLELAKKKSTWQSAYDTTKRIIPYWVGLRESPLKTNSTLSVFKLSNKLNDIKIAMLLIDPLGVKCLTPKTAKEFGNVLKAFGADFGVHLFKKWAKNDSDYRNLNIADFDNFIINLLKCKNTSVDSFADWCLSHRFDLLKRHHGFIKKKHQNASLQGKSPENIKDLVDNLNACFVSNNFKVHQNITDYILSEPLLYPTLELSKQLIAYIQTKSASDFKTWHFDKIVKQLHEKLQAELLENQRDPNDWSINEKNICKCQYCLILSSFLKSKTTKEKIWPLAKNNRQHIHQTIQDMALPVTHNTIHEGSPHKLVLKKTMKLFSDNKTKLKDLNTAINSIKKINKK